MVRKREFIDSIINGNRTDNDFIYFGAAMLKGEVFPEAAVKIPLKSMNRHGLIAGATGAIPLRSSFTSIRSTGTPLSDKFPAMICRVFDFPDQLESIIKLIRSKGVTTYFVPQNPADIPADVLGQLGLKIQYALQALTAKDGKPIKPAAENYPLSPFYDTKNIITSLGTGESLVSALDEKKGPSPLAAMLSRGDPMSRMDILSEMELTELSDASASVARYNEQIDRESAYGILTSKKQTANAQKLKDKAEAERTKVEKSSSRRPAGNIGNTQKALVKVLTSATFIRRVMGVLNKLVK